MKSQHIRRNKVVIITLSLTILCVYVILQTQLSPDLYFIHWTQLENVSCYYLDAEDVLPSGDDVRFPEKSVFFHETSCKGGLDARQTCAVESAARHHPNWQINVLFTAPATKNTLKNSTSLLNKYGNINFYRIHLLKYAKGTPLEKFVAGGALNRTRWRISHASDVLRYLSLYKWGGVYLDLDVLVAKSLETLAMNWSARESEDVVAAGAMAFSKDQLGRRVAEAAVRDIKSNYRGDVWGHNGPGVITRVLQSLCSTEHPNEMTAANCKGFEVYPPEMFYPIPWKLGELYFNPGHIDLKDAYVYHVWNHKTQNYKVARGSPYEMLAKKYCPITYKTFKADFGWFYYPIHV